MLNTCIASTSSRFWKPEADPKQLMRNYGEKLSNLLYIISISHFHVSKAFFSTNGKICKAYTKEKHYFKKIKVSRWPVTPENLYNDAFSSASSSFPVFSLTFIPTIPNSFPKTVLSGPFELDKHNLILEKDIQNSNRPLCGSRK